MEPVPPEQVEVLEQIVRIDGILAAGNTGAPRRRRLRAQRERLAAQLAAMTGQVTP